MVWSLPCGVLCCRFEPLYTSWVPLVQLVERSPRLQSVVGSNPTQGSSSSFLWKERAVLGVVNFFLALPSYLITKFVERVTVLASWVCLSVTMFSTTTCDSNGIIATLILKRVILMKLLRQKLLRENQVNKPICKLPLTYLVCLLPVCILWRHHGGWVPSLAMSKTLSCPCQTLTGLAS